MTNLYLQEIKSELKLALTKKNNTTMFAPGSKISSPEEITYLKEKI